MVSKAREDLPEPESPVMTVRDPRGISTSMLRRLCSRAPRTISRSSGIAWYGIAGAAGAQRGGEDRRTGIRRQDAKRWDAPGPPPDGRRLPSLLEVCLPPPFHVCRVTRLVAVPCLSDPVPSGAAQPWRV